MKSIYHFGKTVLSSHDIGQPGFRVQELHVGMVCCVGYLSTGRMHVQQTSRDVEIQDDELILKREADGTAGNCEVHTSTWKVQALALKQWPCHGCGYCMHMVPRPEAECPR